MLDYDAVSAVLKSLPAFRGLKQEQMEQIFDRFEARQELYKGDTLLAGGAPVRVLWAMTCVPALLFAGMAHTRTHIQAVFSPTNPSIYP